MGCRRFVVRWFFSRGCNTTTDGRTGTGVVDKGSFTGPCVVADCHRKGLHPGGDRFFRAYVPSFCAAVVVQTVKGGRRAAASCGLVVGIPYQARMGTVVVKNFQHGNGRKYAG